MQHPLRQVIDEPVKPILTGPFSRRADRLCPAIAKAIVPLPASVSLPLPKCSPHQPEFFLSRKCPFIGFRYALFSPQLPHDYSPISVMSITHFPRDDSAKDPTTPRTKPPAIPPTAVPTPGRTAVPIAAPAHAPPFAPRTLPAQLPPISAAEL